MTFNRDNHHRRSIRLRDFDYGVDGAYFVTICTFERECLFGENGDGAMQLNAMGRMARNCWTDLPNHFARIALDEFVIMPNHLHGIIVIDGKGTACRAPTRESFGCPVAGSLGTAVRSFKSAAARHINLWRATAGMPIWQRNYYERVIRNDRELDAIRQYIADNPARWGEDENHPTC